MLRPRQQWAGGRRLTADTGSHCPLSGLWAPMGEEAARLRVMEGSIMPTYRNGPVRWTLLLPFTGLVSNRLQAGHGLQAR